MLSWREIRRYSDWKFFASLAGIILVALVATGTIVLCLHRVMTLRQASIKITRVQSRFDDFRLSLLRTETAQRRFILTGDESFLTDYQETLAHIEQEGPQLKAVSKPYGYADKVAEAVDVAHDRIASLEAGIAARRSDGLDAAVDIIQTGRGLRDTERIENLYEVIAQTQADDLAAKRTEATRYGTWAYWIAGAMWLIIGLLAAQIYLLFIQAIAAQQALNRAKDEFVSLASHQLRTPATGVKLILSMLESGDLGSLNTQQSRLVKQAVQRSEYGLRVMEELLTVARADSGRLTLVPRHLNLGEVIQAVAEGHRPATKAKHQQLIVDVPSRAVEFEGDAEKLGMALDNLIDNACKYTPTDGSISIRLSAHPKTIILSVHDTGRGIEKADLPRIFERFQRTNDSTASAVEGTGLGLYLARYVAELHGGSLKVASKPGTGTTFIMSLPRRKRVVC